MLDRIQLILKSKNLSASKFAEEIGVQRSAISHILSGRNNPSLEFIQKILSHYPEIKTDWLMFGKGQMYKELQLFEHDVITPQEFKNEDSDLFLKNPEPSESYSDDQDNIISENVDQIHASAPIHSNANQNKSIEKIIIFYSDKSFSEYKPE